MRCKFVIDQKVICIHTLPYRCDGKNEVKIAEPPVKVGSIYTIKDMDADATPQWVMLELKEIGGNQWFAHTAFRPLDERKTDISVFTSILNTKQKELVD